MKKFIPHALLSIWAILFFVGAFNPYDRNVWIVESSTVWIVLIPIIIMYFKGIRFSNTAYVVMSIFIFLHTIGAHYTFERVPFAWFNNFFGFERNMYDRVAHFSVGFYALPIYQFLRNRNIVRSGVAAGIFALCIIISVAAVYELFEWQFAVLSDPAAGNSVLGSQGDIWDAQKDMLSDTLGAVTVLLGLWLKGLFFKQNTN